MTVVERGGFGDINDFTWLLAKVAREGQVLPKLNVVEQEYIVNARACMGALDRLVLVSAFGANNTPAALKLLEL